VTPHFLAVRQPSTMAASRVASSRPTFVQLLVTYTVPDQFRNPMELTFVGMNGNHLCE